jgi:hypothetical protein
MLDRYLDPENRHKDNNIKVDLVPKLLLLLLLPNRG